MKIFRLIASLLLLSSVSSAQVYTFKPKYALDIVYGDDMDSSPYLDRISESSITCIVDLDNKTVTVPGGKVFPEPRTYPITDIIKNPKDNSYLLKMKADKDVGVVWSYFRLRLDSENKPVHLMRAERLTGKRFARDTFFAIYTNDLNNTLFFTLKSSYAKRQVPPPGDKATRDEAMQAFLASKATEEKNTIVLRDGYLYWTEGSGRKAVTHTFLVDRVENKKEKRGNPIFIYTKESNGQRLELSYLTNLITHTKNILMLRWEGERFVERISIE